MRPLADIEADWREAAQREHDALQTRNLYPAKWQQAHAEAEAALAALCAAVEASCPDPQQAEPREEAEYDHQQHLDDCEERSAAEQLQKEEAEWRATTSPSLPL